LAGFSKGAYRGAQSANTSKTIDRTHNGESIQRDWGKAVAKSDGLGGFGGCHGSDGGMQHLSSAKSGASAPPSGVYTTVNGVRLLTDCSAVVGKVDPGAIQWLLLRAKSQEGLGKLSEVAYIRRTDTKGGVAPRTGCVALLVLFPTTILASATEGLVTKPSANAVDATLDRLEAALKERGFIIFARLDHAAAAQSVGLTMPRSTVLVFGNPRLGTPNFIQHPTYAIDLPLKALVWEDANGKVWVSYNASEWTKVINGRHGVLTDPGRMAQADAVLDAATDAATK
jgi:uncharacterized protein (DUF302 family)